MSAVRAPWAVLLAVIAAGTPWMAGPPRAGAAVPRAPRVRIAFPADSGSLTPYSFGLGYPLMTLVYDTLLWRDADGTPVPWLARSVQTSDAGRRLTVRLRDGVRWQDGRRLTAADVAFTFAYVARHFQPRFTPELEAVAGATARGRLTVVITLRHRSPGFADQPLSDLPILPRHLWQGLPAGTRAPPGLPVGSGPYRLARHQPGRSYRFEANPQYFRGRPRVGNIDVPIIGGFDATLRALEARRVDMIPLTLPAAAQARVRRPAFKTSFGALYTGTTLVFNLRAAPFDRPQARRAVADALDLPRIVRSENAGTTLDVPADRGYLHPDSGWTTPGRIYLPQLARARRAFARMRLPVIDVIAPTGDPVRLEAGRQVVLALTRAGARARLRPRSASRLAAAVGQNGSAPRFQAAIGSSPALASFDPDFLREEFGSSGAPLNASGYRSAAFDRLAAGVAAASSPDERRRLVKSELDLIARDAPEVPLFFRRGAFVFRPQVYDGWVYVPGTGILDKRSFLPGVQAVARPGAGGPPPPAPATDGGIGVIGVVALGLLGGVLVILVLGAASWWRRR